MAFAGQVAKCALALVALGLVGAAIHGFGGTGLGGPVASYMLAIAVCALFLGLFPSLCAAALSFRLLEIYYGASHLSSSAGMLAALLLNAGVVSFVADKLKARTLRAAQRETEITLLFEASETISREVDANGAADALSEMLRRIFDVPSCIVWRVVEDHDSTLRTIGLDQPDRPIDDTILRLAKAAAEMRVVIGFDEKSDALVRKGALDGLDCAADAGRGVYTPLATDSKLAGVLYIAPRRGNLHFSDSDQHMIKTLANHLAVAIERDSLSHQAAQSVALRESDKLKDAIVSLVSHELKSPLAAIKATVSSAEMNGDSKMAIHAITGQVDRLDAIINNLLDLSRLEGGAWKPDRDWCDIAEIVSTCLDRLPERDAARVKVEIEPDLPLVCADYIQTALALSNLLQNAFKYSPDDSPVDLKVCTELNWVDERPSGIEMRVRDYGKGIPVPDLDRVFERFYRSKTHERSGVSGTGLGLSLVKAIMDAQSGKVWAANAPKGTQRGAIFTLVLPLE